MAQQRDLFLGIDVGTSGTKALLVTGDGRPLVSATVEYPCTSPGRAGRSKTPRIGGEATVEATRRVLEKAGVDGSAVAAVGFSGQMHGSVFLDEKGEVIRPPILWCDVRTAAQCRTITDKVGGRERLIELTGNPALEGFTAPKVVWLMENEPDDYARVRHILLPKDYVRYRLTGELAAEVSDAAGTLLFDVAKGEWSQPVLDALGIKRELLPPVLQSFDVAGKVTRRSERRRRAFSRERRWSPAAPTTRAAPWARGSCAKGVFLSSIGSSGVVLTPSDTLAKDPGGRVHTFNHSTEGQWYLMGVTLSAGLSLKWFRDQMGHAEKAIEAAGGPDAYDLLAAQASQEPAGQPGALFPALPQRRTDAARRRQRPGRLFRFVGGAHPGRYGPIGL